MSPREIDQRAVDEVGRLWGTSMRTAESLAEWLTSQGIPNPYGKQGWRTHHVQMALAEWQRQRGEA